MRRTEKENKVAMYSDALAGASFAFLTEFGRMSVPDVDAFRADLRKMGCRAHVVKNTLARIVFERNNVEQIVEYLAGPSLLISGSGEVSPVAKALVKAARRYPTLKLKAIVYESAVYPADQIKHFTDMPTTAEIRARLAGVFCAPLSMFVRVLNGPQRVASVLKQYADKMAKESQ
jgi:large subunit ribosomal protein L10